jgi:thiol-disulfide isomerase/thioredoxin
MSAVRSISCLVFSLLVAACAAAKVGKADSTPVILSVQGLVCVDCGGELEELAKGQPGVRSAHFDAKKIELAIELAPGTSPDELVTALEAQTIDGKKLTILVGPGQGRFAPFNTPDPTWDAKLLSEHGEDVNGFEPSAGKVTVIDFSADWCGPCHQLDDLMHGVLKADAEHVAYRRLNVVDWDSPLAKHYLSGVSGLPYVLVLDRSAKEIARLVGYNPAELKAAIAQGLRP